LGKGPLLPAARRSGRSLPTCPAAYRHAGTLLPGTGPLKRAGV